MLILEVVLFVFWVMLGAFVYGGIPWLKKRLVQRAEAAGTVLSEKERKNLEKMIESRPKALFACGMAAASMFLIILAQLK